MSKKSTTVRELLKKRGSRETSCRLPYEALGWKYMENARRRTKDNPWNSFIAGLALTMTRNAAGHKQIIDEIKSQAPTVEAARELCARQQPQIASAKLAYDPDHIPTSICTNASEKEVKLGSKKYPSWSHLENALRQCTNPNPVIEGKLGVREAIRKHYTFGQKKGPDMQLLEAGCETPVMDIWMLRWALGEALPQDWTETQVNAELRRMQNHVEDYALAKEEIKKEAEACNLPAGVYHVAKWFELAVGTREAADEYLQELIRALK